MDFSCGENSYVLVCLCVYVYIYMHCVHVPFKA